MFQFRTATGAAGFSTVNATIELWWLCGRCCASMTLMEDGSGVKLVPLKRSDGMRPRRDLDLTGSDD